MDKVRYITEDNVIEVFKPQNIDGMYRVEWNGEYIGYIFVSAIDEETGSLTWGATTDYVKLYLEDLGLLVEASGMM